MDNKKLRKLVTICLLMGAILSIISNVIGYYGRKNAIESEQRMQEIKQTLLKDNNFTPRSYPQSSPK